jgi:hypothetical protein
LCFFPILLHLTGSIRFVLLPNFFADWIDPLLLLERTWAVPTSEMRRIESQNFEHMVNNTHTRIDGAIDRCMKGECMYSVHSSILIPFLHMIHSSSNMDQVSPPFSACSMEVSYKLAARRSIASDPGKSTVVLSIDRIDSQNFVDSSLFMSDRCSSLLPSFFFQLLSMKRRG